MQWRNLNAASLTMCWSQHLCFFLDVWVGPIVRERRFWVVTRVSCALLRDRSGHIGALRQREPLPSTWCSRFDWCWHPMRVRYYTPYTAKKHNWMSCTFHVTWALKLFQLGFFDLALREFMFTFRKYLICHRLSSSVHKISFCLLPNRPMKEGGIRFLSVPGPARRGHNDLYISRLF